MDSGDWQRRSTGQSMEGARTALMPDMNDTLAPEETTATSEEEAGEGRTGEGAWRPAPRLSPRHGLRARQAAPWAIMMSVLVLVGTLLLMLADTGRTSAGRAHLAPTATAAPTASATAQPSPTPMHGYTVYVDRSDGFLLQMPQNWTSSPASPGIEFADDANSPAYIVQVLVPGTATTLGPLGEQDDANSWVDYELDSLAKQWPQANFLRASGPVLPGVFGGVQWQSGIGMISANNTRIRVQVYATIYQGRPYVINLLAADDRFEAGRTQYFTPMLQSFAFLAPTA